MGARAGPARRAVHTRSRPRAPSKKKNSHALPPALLPSSHLEHKPVLARVHRPHQDRVQDLVILFGLSGPDVDELPLEV